MSFFSKAQDDEVMGSFILTEIRDLRKGMEGRDGELRGEITAVRDAVSTLGESVTRSNSKVDRVQDNLETVTGDIHRLRQDVDIIQKSNNLADAKAQAEWNGPKRILAIITIIGGVAASATAMIKAAPGLLAFLLIP